MWVYTVCVLKSLAWFCIVNEELSLCQQSTPMNNLWHTKPSRWTLRHNNLAEFVRSEILFLKYYISLLPFKLPIHHYPTKTWRLHILFRLRYRQEYLRTPVNVPKPAATIMYAVIIDIFCLGKLKTTSTCIKLFLRK